MEPIRGKKLSGLLQTEMNHWDNLQRTGRYFACGTNFQAAHRQAMRDIKGQDDTLMSIGLKSGAFRGRHREAFIDLESEGRDWRVLEIGAGYGGYAPIFCRLCREYVGTDVSNYIVTKGNMALKKIGLDNAILHWTPKSDLREFEGDEFDLIFASGVFIHLPSPITRGYISQTAGLLKKDGHFLFHFNILTDEDVKSTFEEAYGIKANHRMRYDEKDYQRLFKGTGLEIQQECDVDVGGDGFQARYVYGGLRSFIDEQTALGKTE